MLISIHNIRYMKPWEILRQLPVAIGFWWFDLNPLKPYGWPGAFANTHPNLGWGLSAHSPILRYGQDPNPTAIANCHSILRVLNTRTPILRHIQNPILRHAQSCRYIWTFFMCSLCAFSSCCRSGCKETLRILLVNYWVHLSTLYISPWFNHKILNNICSLYIFNIYIYYITNLFIYIFQQNQIIETHSYYSQGTWHIDLFLWNESSLSSTLGRWLQIGGSLQSL